MPGHPLAGRLCSSKCRTLPTAKVIFLTSRSHKLYAPLKHFDNQCVFNEWFRGSKAVTPFNEPLKLFPGMAEHDWDIEKMDLRFPGVLSLSTAKEFSTNMYLGEKVVKRRLYASVQNPANLDDPKLRAELSVIYNLDYASDDDGFIEDTDPNDSLLWRRLVVRYLIQKGYDGTVCKEYGANQRTWSVFKVQQIGYERRFSARSARANEAEARFFVCT